METALSQFMVRVGGDQASVRFPAFFLLFSVIERVCHYDFGRLIAGRYRPLTGELFGEAQTELKVADTPAALTRAARQILYALAVGGAVPQKYTAKFKDATTSGVSLVRIITVLSFLLSFFFRIFSCLLCLQPLSLSGFLWRRYV